jgi:hypothetical protein
VSPWQVRRPPWATAETSVSRLSRGRQRHDRDS